MVRILGSLVVNFWLLLTWLPSVLFKKLASRPPVAVWARLSGRVPYLAPPRRGGWLVRRFQRSRGGRERDPSSIRTLIKDLETLSNRPEVKAVILELEGFEGGGASLSAVREAVKNLKAKGKKVFGYSLMATTGEYRLLAAADQVVMGPGGRLELSGYEAEVLSLRKVLEQFGVRPQFVRRGEFKTAPEMFTRDRISPAQKLTIDTLLDERLAGVLDAMAEGRGKTEKEARDALDHGPYSGRRAIEAGLADQVIDPAGMEIDLKKEHGDKLAMIPWQAVEGIHRAELSRFRPIRRPRCVGIVPVNGPHQPGAAEEGRWAGADSIVESLQEAAKAKSVKIDPPLHRQSRLALRSPRR